MEEEQLKFQKMKLLKSLFGFSMTDIALRNFHLNETQKNHYNEKLNFLAQGVPFDYVVGELVTGKGLRFLLDENVLIPRPETEELIEMVLTLEPQELIVDVGTGSGFIGISIASQAKNIIMTDISEEALEVCVRNVELNGVKNVEVFHSNLLENVDLVEKIKDAKSWILIANLPYVPNPDKLKEHEHNTKFEPDLAIYSGKDGLDLFHHLIDQLHHLPLPDQCFFELDPRNINQARIFLRELFQEIEMRKDEHGFERFLIGRN
jgi:release factor glutamine methyltransferase